MELTSEIEIYHKKEKKRSNTRRNSASQQATVHSGNCRRGKKTKEKKQWLNGSCNWLHSELAINAAKIWKRKHYLMKSPHISKGFYIFLYAFHIYHPIFSSLTNPHGFLPFSTFNLELSRAKTLNLNAKGPNRKPIVQRFDKLAIL